jgi:hypothetical protein
MKDCEHTFFNQSVFKQLFSRYYFMIEEIRGHSRKPAN